MIYAVDLFKPGTRPGSLSVWSSSRSVRCFSPTIRGPVRLTNSGLLLSGRSKAGRVNTATPTPSGSPCCNRTRRVRRQNGNSSFPGFSDMDVSWRAGWKKNVDDSEWGHLRSAANESLGLTLSWLAKEKGRPACHRFVMTFLTRESVMVRGDNLHALIQALFLNVSTDNLMPNENCLEGVTCPECGQTESVQVQVLRWVTVLDEGTDDEGGDTEYDDDTPAKCPECGHEGTFGDFSNGESDERA